MFASTIVARETERFAERRTARHAPWSGDPSVFGLASTGLQATVVTVAPNAEIVGQGEPAGTCYFVLSGCIRTVHLMEDGRRQLGEFLLPGDLFGWEELDEHSFGAEAVSASMLLSYSQMRLRALAACDAALAERLRSLTASQLRANRERMLLLGRKRATERIATFLLEMAARLRANENGWIALPMSRTDIADYLGLTIETVCRGITHFRNAGIISAEGPRFTIRDHRALELAGCESFR